MELTLRTVFLLFANYITFVFKNPDYQISVFNTNKELVKALYSDIVNMYNMGDLPAQSFMSVGQMAIQSGYAYEEHKIMTEDGYILTTYRLPGKLTEN